MAENPCTECNGTGLMGGDGDEDCIECVGTGLALDNATWERIYERRTGLTLRAKEADRG